MWWCAWAQAVVGMAGDPDPLAPSHHAWVAATMLLVGQESLPSGNVHTSGGHAADSDWECIAISGGTPR